MRCVLASLASLALCAACRNAGTRGERPVAVQPAPVVSGPWMLAPSSRAMTIAWTTDAPSTGVVRYGLLQSGGQMTGRASESAPATDHRIRIEGLTPATRYTFRIDGAPPAEGSFVTAPEATSGDRFRIVVYGDNRTNGGDHALVARAVGSEDAVLALHTGDMVVNAKDAQAWRTWFADERDLLAHVPLVPTVGNHELTDRGVAYARWFQPADRPAYHALDYGPVHLVVLDSFEIAAGASPQHAAVSDAQREWLLADLQAVPRDRHVFVLVHQGPFAHPAKLRGSWHGGSDVVRLALEAAKAVHPIEAVFAGHEHFYERGDLEGLRYFVIGGGGAPLDDPDPSAPGVASAKKALSYVVVDVQGCNAVARARDIAGNVFDAVTLASCSPGETQAAAAPPPDGGTR